MGNTEHEFGADLEQWVIKTRRAQGLPDRVEDPVVLAQVVELLFGLASADQESDMTETSNAAQAVQGEEDDR